MIIGFTGTRHGMTVVQNRNMITLLQDLDPEWVHHGDCLGADHQVDLAAQLLDICRHVHPCNIASQRAYCAGEVIESTLAPLVRNRVIVDACALLLAAPDTTQERRRSGTWSTVRYARRIGRPIKLLLPDGEVLDG